MCGVVWLLDGVWIGWLDSLTTCIHHSELQVIKHYFWSTHFTAHRVTRSRILSLHYSYPGNWFEHGDYTDLTVTTTHMKSSFHSLISFSIIFDCRLKRLPQILFPQLAWDNRCTALGRPQQRTTFLNNSSIVIEKCLPRRWIETAVFLLLLACSFLPSRCLAINCSEFQASFHSIINYGPHFVLCFWNERKPRTWDVTVISPLLSEVYISIFRYFYCYVQSKWSKHIWRRTMLYHNLIASEGIFRFEIYWSS
jgi:hypothetical protein